MADIGSIVGGTLMSIGGFSIVYGVITCFTSPNQYYNKEDVEAMVAATVLAEKASKEKNDSYFEDQIKNDVAQKKRRVMVAS